MCWISSHKEQENQGIYSGLKELYRTLIERINLRTKKLLYDLHVFILKARENRFARYGKCREKNIMLNRK